MRTCIICIIFYAFNCFCLCYVRTRLTCTLFNVMWGWCRVCSFFLSGYAPVLESGHHIIPSPNILEYCTSYLCIGKILSFCKVFFFWLGRVWLTSNFVSIVTVKWPERTQLSDSCTKSHTIANVALYINILLQQTTTLYIYILSPKAHNTMKACVSFYWYINTKMM